MISQQSDTIVALSSGSLPSGIAVIRATGPKARDLCALFGFQCPKPRYAKFVKFKSPKDNSIVDEGLALFFEGPNSFSGEDLVEFQVHGSKAVVAHLIEQATTQEDIRLAQPGEFTRRAFENGKLDLTRVEGIADLIDAQTEAQRELAVSRMRGGLTDKLKNWREAIVRLRAEIEARLDFSDEDDVPFDLPTTFHEDIKVLASEISEIASTYDQGRIIREGFRVALVGEPNVGKSSLLNALTKSDIAIVTDVPGTTRDVIEASINIDGQLLHIIDTAGIRETEDHVEKIGIERAQREIDHADLVLVLTADGNIPKDIRYDAIVETKRDSRETPLLKDTIGISVKQKNGLDDLYAFLKARLSENDSRETLLISHSRDREALTRSAEILNSASQYHHMPELLAEELRQAGYYLARLLGDIDTEDVLDELFAGFCIGK